MNNVINKSELQAAHYTKQVLGFNFDRVASKQEIEVIKIIGHRLRESRRLCEHKTNQAAALLGVTPCDLKNIEGVVDAGSLPLWLISRAAEVYCVPIDYLFGLIDDWDAADGEAFQSRNHLADLQRQQLEDFTKNAAELLQQHNRLIALNSAIAAFGMAVQYISEVFIQFRQLNPVVFDNMPGSARVLRQMKLAEELGGHATGALARYKALPESLALHAEEMNKVFPNHAGSFTD